MVVPDVGYRFGGFLAVQFCVVAFCKESNLELRAILELRITILDLGA